LTDPHQFSGRVRVAVLSFLFNWPSTGGGNMHTAGLVEFLGRAGYGVRHFYARYPAWGIERVVAEDGGASTEDEGRRAEVGESETCGRAGGGVGDPRRTESSEAIEFAESDWNVPEIQRRFRAAVDSFAPDYVVISDTWNMKPHLAEACARHDEAVVAYRQSLRYRPIYAATYLNLGYALKDSGRLEEAAAAWEQTARLAPYNPAPRQELSRLGRCPG
jgi:hypothetical protein